jgi:hypothetical protein
MLAGVGFLHGKAAALGVAVKETSCIIQHLLGRTAENQKKSGRTVHLQVEI